MRRFAVVSATMVLVLTGALAGCRGGETSSDEGKGGVKTDVGVTSEPCPNAIDRNKGCIYLGALSDLTVGPFRALAGPITEAQKKFWERVNRQGGIGDYEVDAVTYIRDNKYNPEVHNQVYQEIKSKVLALSQTLGSPTTAAIINDLRQNNVVAAPASWTSAWAFEDVIVESGANYCIESMNALDYAAGAFNPKSVMAVHYAGDYGDDAAAGAKLYAQAKGWTFTDVKTDAGQDKQAGAIDRIVSVRPEVVILTTGPTETAVIVGQAAARGFTGKFIGTSPGWNPGLMDTPAAPALQALYLQSVPWNSWSTDTAGHKAMREALGSVTPNEGYTSGWVWSYPLKAALQKAVQDKDLTRAGMVKAVKSLTSVDYEGMLPSGAGNYAGGPNAMVRATGLYKPDPTAVTKVSRVQDLTVGPTARDFQLDKPCFQKL